VGTLKPGSAETVIPGEAQFYAYGGMNDSRGKLLQFYATNDLK